MPVKFVSKYVRCRVISSRLFCTSGHPTCEERPKPFSAIPSPRNVPVFGHLYLFSKLGPYSFSKLYDAYQDLYSKYGPIVRLNLGKPMILLFQPEDVQKLYTVDGSLPRRPLFDALRYHRLKEKKLKSAGLVTENGPEWQRLRQATNFLMKPPFAQAYISQQNEIAEDFIKRIRRLRSSDGEVKNFLPELYRFAAEEVGLVCFGRRLGLLNDEESCRKQSEQIVESVHHTLQGMADTLLGFPWWKVFNTLTYKKLVQSQNFFHGFAAECLKEAKQKVLEKDENSPLMFLEKLMTDQNLSESDISLVMTEIFSAGIDATGNTIGFVLYNLAQRKDIQDKLYAEIVEHVTTDQTMTPALLSELQYLRICIKESHRLTPVAGGSARILNTPTVLAGFEIPADVLCLGINPTICRQSKHFENPLEFRPERWTVENKKPHPYCVMPFSHGVRRCLGQRFAEQEIKLCLLKIVQNFRVDYDGATIGCKMRLSLTPDKDLNFKFSDR